MAEGHNFLAKLFLSLVALLHPQYIITGPLVKSYLNTRVSKVAVCRDAAFFNRFRSFVKLSKEIIFQLKLISSPYCALTTFVLFHVRCHKM